MAIRTNWYAIDIAEERAELSVFDEIGGGGISVSEFKNQFDLVKDRKEIRLLLNSPGGAVTEGIALYNLLASVRSKLVIEVIGLAASIASIVALAGRELVMDEGTYFMIHNPWTVTWGDAGQLRKDADVLDKMRNELVNIYAAHSKVSPDEIGTMMDEETWLTAEEAKVRGFASSIAADSHMSARAAFDLSRIGFQHAPRAYASHPDFKDIKSIRDFERFLRDAGASRSEAEALASGGWPRQGDPAEASEQKRATVAALHAAALSLR